MFSRLNIFLLLTCLGPAMASDGNWRAVIGYDPLQHVTACLLESKLLTVSMARPTRRCSSFTMATCFA